MARLIAIILPIALLTGCGDTGVTRPEPLAFTTPPPFRLTGAPHLSHKAHHFRYQIAHVLKPSSLRSAPDGRVLAHIKTTTEFGSPTFVRVDSVHDGWLKVTTPLLPNDKFGWLPQKRASLLGTDFRIVVDRSAHKGTLMRNDKALFDFPLAVGQPGTETPLGHFAVTDRLTTTDPSSPYGCCALALSGHQPNLEPGWPGGDRLAIHGTPDQASIGQAVTHGCMRTYTPVLHKLLRRVPLGAPVTIHP